MHEYSVGLATPKSSEDMEKVAESFRAGQNKERERIWERIELMSKNGHVSEALFVLREIVWDD